MKRDASGKGLYARRLSAVAWAGAFFALLLWLATRLIAERSVPTLLLTYFFLPHIDSA